MLRYAIVLQVTVSPQARPCLRTGAVGIKRLHMHRAEPPCAHDLRPLVELHAMDTRLLVVRDVATASLGFFFRLVTAAERERIQRLVLIALGSELRPPPA